MGGLISKQRPAPPSVPDIQFPDLNKACEMGINEVNQENDFEAFLVRFCVLLFLLPYMSMIQYLTTVSPGFRVSMVIQWEGIISMYAFIWFNNTYAIFTSIFTHPVLSTAAEQCSGRKRLANISSCTTLPDIRGDCPASQGCLQEYCCFCHSCKGVSYREFLFFYMTDRQSYSSCWNSEY